MLQTQSPQSRIVAVGLFGAISIVLGIVENFIPLPVPGLRLGLANLGVMMMLYIGGLVPAMMVMILKVTLVPLLSGNIFFRLSLSVPSGVMAFIAMAVFALILRKYSSAVSVGVAGAVFHMITQLYVIDKLYIKGIFSTAIVGWFLLAAVVTGILTGIITQLSVERIKSAVRAFG